LFSMDPFENMDHMFAGMMQRQDAMFGNMRRAMSEIQGDRFSFDSFGRLPPGNVSYSCYSSHQVFDSRNPDACRARTQTVEVNPGGVVEARLQEYDGRRGEQKMALRRQLQDKYCEIERKRSVRNGEESTRKTLHNIDNEDVDTFDREWTQAKAGQHHAIRPLREPQPRSVPRPTPSSLPQGPLLAIMDKPSLSPPSQQAPSRRHSEAAPPKPTPPRDIRATAGTAPKRATSFQGLTRK